MGLVPPWHVPLRPALSPLADPARPLPHRAPDLPQFAHLPGLAMSAPQFLLQAALNRLGARVGSGLLDTAAGLAVLAQDAPRRLREELDLFREEVEREAERLENGQADPAAGSSAAAAAAGPWPSGAADPQEQIDALRARVAELARRLEQPPGGGPAGRS
jgi:hypothetical protein